MQVESQETRLDEQFLLYEKLADITDYLLASAIEELASQFNKKIVIEPMAKDCIKANRIHLKSIFHDIKMKIKSSNQSRNSPSRLLFSKDFILKSIDKNNKSLAVDSQSRQNSNLNVQFYNSQDLDGLLDEIDLAVKELRTVNPESSISMKKVAVHMFQKGFFISSAKDPESQRVILQNALTIHTTEIKEIPNANKRWPSLHFLIFFRRNLAVALKD